MSVVTLCQCDISMSYENSMTFKDREEQYYYIKGEYYKDLILNIPTDSHRTEFEVDLPILQAKKFDYCIIGDDFNNLYYYFILGVTQKGTISNVHVQLDVVQTYLFDWEIRESFVDRMHVDRWKDSLTPNEYFEDEGIDYGTLITEEKEEVTKIPLNFIICATTPIGVIDTGKPEPDPSPSPTDIGAKIVNSARKLIGKPYVYGGNYPPLGTDIGTDCSGLCQWAFNDNGKKITRTTYTQVKEGKSIEQSSIKAGDMIFMNYQNGQPEHVVMYSGTSNGKTMCVEAPRTGLNIREREISINSTMHIRRLW